MSDNVPITPGTGAVIATDDVGGVHYQILKLNVGQDGESKPLGPTNRMPVEFPAGATLTVTLDATALAALVAAATPTTQPVSGPLTNAQMRAAPVPVDMAAPTNVTTTAYAKSLVLKAAPGVLYGLSGFNNNTSAQFIQLHDATAEPGANAVPKVLVRVAASSPFTFDFGPRGRAFATGIVVCNSSTGPTATVGAADCWFDGQVG